jgi:hypothetical protein
MCSRRLLPSLRIIPSVGVVPIERVVRLVQFPKRRRKGCSTPPYNGLVCRPGWDTSNEARG